MKVFSGRSNPALVEGMLDYIGAPMSQVSINTFSDGELNIEYLESVRNEDVVIVQSLYPNTHTSLVEACLLATAAKQSKARSVILAIPYVCYSRQDRAEGRSPISIAWIADVLAASGVDRVLVVDIHSDQSIGFFRKRAEYLYASPVHVQEIRRLRLKKPIIVSPDVGGIKRARKYSKKLGLGLAVIDKRRPKPNVAEVEHMLGDVKGKNCLVVDDMMDTAGTMTKGVEFLMDQGAKDVRVFVTHGILSGPAISRIKKSSVKKVYITDTIAQPAIVSSCDKFKILSVGKLLGETLKRVVAGDSLQNMFETYA